ncbi:hypothetical protein EYF80_012633 [Liparis tanakae]|uniref:Uncharacterized protein n=1 Tax=Liparis tanakae TaxID=230148 RepID=A0A4Z2II95_9TELE|nr:hypothetical protein EYF80_012633 [Liparis tanakae]
MKLCSFRDRAGGRPALCSPGRRMLRQQEQQLEVSQHRHQWRESQWTGGALAQNVGQRSEPHGFLAKRRTFQGQHPWDRPKLSSIDREFNQRDMSLPFSCANHEGKSALSPYRLGND